MRFLFNFTIYATVLIKKAFVDNYFTPGDPLRTNPFRVVNCACFVIVIRQYFIMIIIKLRIGFLVSSSSYGEVAFRTNAEFTQMLSLCLDYISHLHCCLDFNVCLFFSFLFFFLFFLCVYRTTDDDISSSVCIIRA